ncbi:holo-ACP synthase [Deinococcus roseus]|uniref:Holo-[acyl-carrier-protein] synthase n=1 Tax=Deinococcus roseus TaxID=392414 RepID=A0ABQ2D0W4_9DEIO|nr:holo-ACP synthase [Deinococcus roseus]GGJ40052.1 holo-[acyl-carrier-protein] synthase [Deinococcus roseus]
MIVAIGTDLIEIHRIRKVLEREGEHFLHKIFTPEELAYCLKMADPVPSLAARFAAKEAFQKTWFEGHSWQDVWVVRDETPQEPFPFSRPYLKFSPEVQKNMQANHWVAHLSLTHTKEHAQAVVVLEKLEQPHEQ